MPITGMHIDSAEPGRLPKAGRHLHRGFTLVEILIVVVILGILAAIAVPRFTNASNTARESTLRDQMRFLRSQIAVYVSQHHEIYPGYPSGDMTGTPDAATFVAQMTMFSDEYGNTSATQTTACTFGPYLLEIPANPCNSLTTITIVPAGGTFTPDGTSGWLYQPSTGKLEPNLTTIDSTGTPFSSY